MKFDYAREPSRDILCIDCKSFYSSVECAERALNTLKTIYKSFVADEYHSAFSVEESLLYMTDALMLFKCKNTQNLIGFVTKHKWVHEIKNQLYLFYF